MYLSFLFIALFSRDRRIENDSFMVKEFLYGSVYFIYCFVYGKGWKYFYIHLLTFVCRFCKLETVAKGQHLFYLFLLLLACSFFTLLSFPFFLL